MVLQKVYFNNDLYLVFKNARLLIFWFVLHLVNKIHKSKAKKTSREDTAFLT